MLVCNFKIRIFLPRALVDTSFAALLLVDIFYIEFFKIEEDR